MAGGAMPKPLQDLAGLFLVTMVGGAILIGWLNNRSRPRRGDGTPLDGLGADDAPHHHGWWSDGGGDGGHHGSGDADGDGGGH